MNLLVQTAHAHELVIGGENIETNYDYALFIHHPAFSTVIGALMAITIAVCFLIAVYLFCKQLKRKGKRMSIIQMVAWYYALQLYVLLALIYVPGFTDGNGGFLGLFKLDLIDDLLHLGSAVWAMTAAYISTKQSVNYFKIFGTLYFLDGVCGTLMGRSFLSLALPLYGPLDRSILVGLSTNFPHILIGGFAMFMGFVVGRRVR